MAAGENPKNVYGDQGVLPSTRMGNISLKDVFNFYILIRKIYLMGN